jgi:hypothetical protein
VIAIRVAARHGEPAARAHDDVALHMPIASIRPSVPLNAECDCCCDAVCVQISFSRTKVWTRSRTHSWSPWLVSDEADWITGQVLASDGGWCHADQLARLGVIRQGISRSCR